MAATRQQTAKEKAAVAAAAVAASRFGSRGRTVSPWKDPLLFKNDESGYLFDPMPPTFIPSAMAASKLGGRGNPVSPWKKHFLFSPAEGDEVKKPLVVVTPVKPKGKVLQEMAQGELETEGVRGECGIRTRIQAGNVI